MLEPFTLYVVAFFGLVRILAFLIAFTSFQIGLRLVYTRVRIGIKLVRYANSSKKFGSLELANLLRNLPLKSDVSNRLKARLRVDNGLFTRAVSGSDFALS